MSVSSKVCALSLCATMAACGQSLRVSDFLPSSDVTEQDIAERFDDIDRLSNQDEVVATNVQTTTEPLGQVDEEPEEQQPPLATFSSYGGVKPGETGGTRKPVTYTAPENVKKIARPARKQTDNGAVATSPRPAQRPVSGTPRPVRRPDLRGAQIPSVKVQGVGQTAAAQTQQTGNVEQVTLPAAPSISLASLPSLDVPLSYRDDLPSNLPTELTSDIVLQGGTLPVELGLANIKAAEASIPVADTLEKSIADESGTLGWDDAVSLFRAGEVDSAIDVGEFEVLMTLCSGRGILTIQPEPGALKALESPKVVCGRTVSLASE